MKGNLPADHHRQSSHYLIDSTPCKLIFRDLHSFSYRYLVPGGIHGIIDAVIAANNCQVLNVDHTVKVDIANQR